MRLHNERGSFNALLIPLILFILLFLGALGFGIWAFSSRQDYKDNADVKIATAVKVAEEKTATEKDNEFLEKEKQPLKSYTGPATYGTVSFSFPKTWSAQIDESGKGSNPLSGYLHPNFVPTIDNNTNFALRVTVSESAYDNEIKQFETLAKSGAVKVTPFAAAKVPNTVGIRVDGDIITKKRGSMVVLPLRDKTLKIWTESDQFVKDFNELILPNLSFVP